MTRGKAVVVGVALLALTGASGAAGYFTGYSRGAAAARATPCGPNRSSARCRTRGGAGFLCGG